MTNRRRVRVALLVAALVATGSPGVVAAQQGPPGRMELERRVRARFGELVRERLGLTPEEQRELGEVLRTYQEEREALALREAQLRRRVATHGVLGGRDVDPLLDDEEALEILSEWEAIWEEERRLVRDEQEALLDLLTPAQLVRLYALREALNERVRGFRQGGPPGEAGRVGRAGPSRFRNVDGVGGVPLR